MNRDSSGGTGDAEEGALFPLNLEGSCDTYKKATVSAGETLRDNVCYEVKSEGFLDTFSSNLNADAGKDHSCLYDIKVGLSSKTKIRFSFFAKYSWCKVAFFTQVTQWTRVCCA